MRLKEKFNAEGLLPEKLVTIKPFNNCGYSANKIKFEETGIRSPNTLRSDLEISNSNFFFLRSYLINKRKGIKNTLVGLIIILIPKIKLAKKTLAFELRLRNIKREAKMKNVI